MTLIRQTSQQSINLRCCFSNPVVQASAMDSGAMQQLIRMLSTESSVQVKQRIIYALSSLIRHSPYAQKLFIQLGGIQGFSNLFSQRDTEILQMKAVTLVTDVLYEIVSVPIRCFDTQVAICLLRM